MQETQSGKQSSGEKCQNFLYAFVFFVYIIVSTGCRQTALIKVTHIALFWRHQTVKVDKEYL